MVEDVTPEQVWALLETDANARVVDVRTPAEWTFVGVPDLTERGGEPVLLPWQLPGGQVNGQFINGLREGGLTPEHRLLFLCRSGVRSLAAAQAAEAAGFTKVANIAGGFEGPLDEQRHRGTMAGWKASGLPWMQG